MTDTTAPPTDETATLKADLGEIHTDSIHLRFLCECLDEVFQGGMGCKGRTGALINAVIEKSTRLDANLGKLWELVG